MVTSTLSSRICRRPAPQRPNPHSRKREEDPGDRGTSKQHKTVSASVELKKNRKFHADMKVGCHNRWLLVFLCVYGRSSTHPHTHTQTKYGELHDRLQPHQGHKYSVGEGRIVLRMYTNLLVSGVCSSEADAMNIVCASLGMSINTVKPWLKNAVGALEEALEKGQAMDMDSIIPDDHRAGNNVKMPLDRYRKLDALIQGNLTGKARGISGGSVKELIYNEWGEKISERQCRRLLGRLGGASSDNEHSFYHTLNALNNIVFFIVGYKYGKKKEYIVCPLNEKQE